MDKTLYISDLDGTLLAPDARPSAYTVDIVNRFVASGGLFSIATARTYQMAKAIIEPFNIRVPMTFSNGAVLFDPVLGEFTRVIEIPVEQRAKMVAGFEAQGVTGFFATLEGKTVKLYHAPMKREAERKYRDFRMGYYEGHIYEADNLVKEIESRRTCFCVVYGTHEELERVRDAAATPELTLLLYSDVYHPGMYFLDIYSAKVSKADGMLAIAEHCGASRTVAFGDNDNDVPMFMAADESYATANGVDAAKQAATAVIGPYTDDGVARFLAARYNL
jgi:hypothetical protein